MTALDKWLLLSMLTVVMATFEYGVLLAIRFGGKDRINNRKRNIEGKCNKIDHCAFMLFITIYTIATGTYFYYYVFTDRHEHRDCSL